MHRPGGLLGIFLVIKENYLQANLIQVKLRTKIPKNRSENKAVCLQGKMGQIFLHCDLSFNTFLFVCKKGKTRERKSEKVM